MIEHLHGKVLKKALTHVVLDVNGVGYAVHLDSKTYLTLPAEGEEASVWIHTRVREDLFQLFGFLRYEDKQLFEQLISINKVGPKVALAIMSQIDIQQLLAMIESTDTRMLQTVPGVGKTTASKILVELSSKKKKIENLLSVDALYKMGAVSHRDETKWSELESALENLGYKVSEVNKTVRFLKAEEPNLELEPLLKKALLAIQSKAATKTSFADASPLDIF